MRQEWSPQPPRMCEKCVENGPPSPRICEKCVKNGPPSPGCGPPSPGCVKNASRMVPPSPQMCEKCVKNGPPNPPDVSPGCVKSASRMVPPALGCAKNASRMVPPAPGVRKLQQDWSTSVSQFSRKPGLCENCDKIGPPVLSQFSRKMDHCCCSFRTWGGPVLLYFSHVRKLQQHWGTSVVVVFAQTRLCENCNKTGPTSVIAIFARAKNATTLAPPCAKTATTMVHFARKLRQHCSKCAKSATTMVRFVRKLCQHRSPMREKCNNTGGKMCEKCVRV